MAKRVTSKDIAARAGVSRTTVSFVLNNVPGTRITDETRQRVLEAAQQLGYHPDAAARSMVSGRRQVIGFVVRQSTEQAFSDHFLPQVLNGVAQAAGSRGYRTLFEPIPPEKMEDAYTQLIQERHIDGIVLSGPRYDDQELLRLHDTGAHVVMTGQLPQTTIPFVDVNNINGAAQATQHLIDLGHKRIGLITNAPLAYTSSADRLTGYCQALAVAGIPYDETIVRYGDLMPRGGDLAMSELLNLPQPPTAVFVASDTVALGAIQALHRRGLQAPQDVALVGFDDIPLSGFIDPPLTTIHLPAYELGWHAADTLIRLIDGEKGVDSNLILETELVVRDSCGARIHKRID